MSDFVKKRRHPEKDLYLSCYTKKAFYKRKWDDETINARGHVRDSQGNLLSCPFPKLFNLDEHESVSRTELVRRIEEGHTLWVETKWNGHLSILFHDGDGWINTTKGSFTHDFVELDRLLMAESGFTDEFLAEVPENWTLMFEIVATYDPHLMTETHMLQLGGERAVLLAVNDRETGRSVNFSAWGEFFEEHGIWTPYADRTDVFTSMTMNDFDAEQWIDWIFSLENIEGIIIHDPSDDWRVKLKTNWFIKNRYLFQFNNEKTKAIFLKHVDEEDAFAKIPEELHEKYHEILDTYEDFLDRVYESAMDTLLIIFAQYKTVHTAFHFIDNNPDISPDDRTILKAYACNESDFDVTLRRIFADRFDEFALV